MKKLIILLAVFTFVSCDTDNSIPNPDNKNGKGKVSISFRSANASYQKASVEPGSAGDKVFEPTNVKILLQRFENDSVAFHASSDVKVPTDTTVVIQVPAKDNYQIIAFSYIDSTQADTGPYSPVLKIDHEGGISVAVNKTTHVTLKLKPPSPTVTIPDTVKKGDNIPITVDFNNLFPDLPANGDTLAEASMLAYLSYHNSFDIKDMVSAYYNLFYPGSENSTKHDLVWDEIKAVNTDSNIYAYFQIALSFSAENYFLHKVGPSSQVFVIQYPNPLESDTLKTFVKGPKEGKGSIGVDVIY